jgi:iron(II)-dependent oxidoreductase
VSVADWLSPQQLAEWLRESRGRTMELIEDLSDEQLRIPQQPYVNPLLWEVGHLSWFSEKFVLREALQQPPILVQPDAIYDSGAIPHGTRWELTLPSREDTLAYMAEVRDRMVEAVLDPACSDVVMHFALYTVFHEDTHTEALSSARQLVGYPPPKLSGLSHTSTAEADAGALPGDVEVPGGTHLLGALRGDPFCFDNEKWAHPVEVAPFAIARAPVTQGEFAEFVADGGYQRPELWGAGEAWLARTGAQHPTYWRPAGDGWERRVYDQWVPLEPHKPMMHVSYWEAAAYCRWAGRRLPTEAEWEVAAGAEPGSTGLVDARRATPWGDPYARVAVETAQGRANLDWRAMDTVDVAAHPDGDSAFGVRGMLGNVWEWTASPFWAFPNFEADAYADNSAPFFGDHRRVLRGGSWATRSRYVRVTYRNYFTPERRDVFAGFRTCGVA